MTKAASSVRSRVPNASGRTRSGSIQEILDSIECDPTHYIAGAMMSSRPDSTPNASPNITVKTNNSQFKLNKKQQGLNSPKLGGDEGLSKGLWCDFKAMRWMWEPASSFKLLIIPAILYLNFELINRYIFNLPCANPFTSLLFISYYLPESSPSDPRYGKGFLDLAFVGYYVIFFSFIRQSVTIYIIVPIARGLGVKRATKLDRFAEQGYAVLYFGIFGSLGLYIMSQLPTWWFRTEHFWLGYPYRHMTPLMKSYYLLQGSYWAHQLLVLLLGLEKPRKDFTELVIHHFVTIYLVSSSYVVNLTWIGNAVFITMDIPDFFFALSKIFNYLRMNKTKVIAFGWFIIVWSYTRHWLNFVILYSVWFEFDLIPETNRQLDPSKGLFMPWWAKYQIWLPIFLLQLVNLFWYFLIWRILIRTILTPDLDKLDDDRSEDEFDGDDED
ncbi:longevity assurance proteins LAG1/LAC1 [Ceratobasidium sp. AG-I]|nr:longevity assurance proteins LAG1/LAC1 [Ceratobasidium sp. AG-I]